MLIIEMAAPAQFSYEYEYRIQSEKPVNNATYIKSEAIRSDPNFYWQNSGQERRGAKVWMRAIKRKLTPEYKAFLAAEKTRREVEFDALAGLIGQMSMASSGTSNKNGYAQSLISGEPNYVRQQKLHQAAQAAQQLKVEINALSNMLRASGMEGGKKRRQTNKRRHSKSRHTHRRN